MKEIREYLTELEKISTDIINLKYAQNKTYQTLIDRIMFNCRTDVHPLVLAHLHKVKKINKIGYWVHDIKQKLFMATRELLQFLGKDPKQESFSEEDFFNLIHPDDLPRIVKSYAQDVFTYQDRSSAYRMITSKDEVKFVVSHFSTKYNIEGDPIQVTGIIFEIPQTEGSNDYTLKTNRNEVISANMNVGFWEYDPISDREYWSSSLYSIIEATASECDSEINTLKSLIQPSNSKESLKIIEDNNTLNKDYDLTLKITTFKGNEKLVFCQIHHLIDSNGELIKRYGLVYDVTKIKQLMI